MFDSAYSKPLSQVIEAAYYAMRALERRFRPEDLDSTPIMAGLASEPDPEEQDLARHWIEEIQQRENQTIDRLDDKTIEHYLSRLSDVVQERSHLEVQPDPVQGQRLLEELHKIAV